MTKPEIFRGANRDGSLMIESIVATSLVIIGILGIVSLLVSSAHRSASATNQLTATYLAAEEIEVVKNIVDADSLAQQPFGSEFVAGQPYAVSYNATQPTPVDPTGQAAQVYENTATTGLFEQSYDAGGTGEPTVFHRYFVVTQSDGTSTLNVEAVVTWTQDGVNRDVHLDDAFTNWRG